MEKQKDLIYRLDWDVLIILDACRYDFFVRAIKDLGINYSKLLKVKSAGSCTMEWFINTFDRPIDNSIYISGNPYIGNYRNIFNDVEYDPRRIFYRVREAFIDAWRKIEGVYAVSPTIVTKIALVNMMIAPKRKVIVHYMQPHAPYPHAKDLRKYFIDDMGRPDVLLWKALMRGELEPERVKNAYYENLIWVLKALQDIIRLAGRRRIVITSDHGELFGEHGLYNHPCGVRVPELIEVPWCVVAT